MTPRETYLAIDAEIWRDERRQHREVSLAWHTAALMRMKRIPSLKQLLSTKPAKPVQGEDLEKHRQEFKEMTQNVDLSKIIRKKKE